MMRVVLVAVDRPSRLLGPPIREYEDRARRYWKLETVEVASERAGKNRSVDDVKAAEADRLRAAVATDTQIVALTRTGRAWSSRDLARYLNDMAVSAGAGATFLIGGAHGIDDGLLAEASQQVSLSALTLPHELARLVFAEQLYRAGTIVRGEPYHKG